MTECVTSHVIFHMFYSSTKATYIQKDYVLSHNKYHRKRIWGNKNIIIYTK